jgi:hypothetical protein
MKPMMDGRTKLLALVVIIVIILGVVGCSVMMYMGPFIYGDRYYGKGQQRYGGIPNGTLLMYKLNLNGYEPQLEAGFSEVRVFFRPYCGAQGSAQANKSQALMGRSYITIDQGNNTTKVLFMTQQYVDSGYNSNNISEVLKCAMEKTKTLFTTEIGLTFQADNMSKEKYFMPGFEAALLVPAMVVISLIWRRRMMAQKE